MSRSALLVLTLWGCTEPALPYGASSASCASCHPDHAAEWAASGHGTSAASPVFTALLPRVEAAWGGFARDTCEGCHAPGARGDAGLDPDDIGCVSCHAAVGDHGASDAALAVDLSQPLSGPLGAAAGVTDAHTSVDRGFLTSPDLCGTCHEVTGPGLLFEDTLGEYLSSPSAEAGLGCVDCHAPLVPDRPSTPDTPARASHDHRFVGVAERLLGVDDLLPDALALIVTGTGVTVTNLAGGHSVPTGVSWLRDVWVDVDGRSAPLLRLGDQPLADGVPVALITDADEVRPGGLAAGASITVPWPEGITSTVTVHLRARAVRPEVLDALGLDEPDPVYELATITGGPGSR